MKIVKSVNRFEVLEGGFIQVRLEKQLLDDGLVIEHLGFERFLLTPDTVLDTIEYEEIKNVANVVWKPEVIASYKLNFENSSF